MEHNDIKERILNGAKELFQKYGIRSITMDEIAHQQGISKKTIYQYFSDKDDIVTLLMSNYLRHEREAFEQLRKESKNIIHQLFDVTVHMKRNINDLSGSLIFDLRKYHVKAWSMLLEFKYGFVREIIVDNLNAGIEQGYFRAGINTDILSMMRLEVVTLAQDEHLFPRDKYNANELQIHLFDHFIHGIMTDKGRKVYKKYKDDCEQSDCLHENVSY